MHDNNGRNSNNSDNEIDDFDDKENDQIHTIFGPIGFRLKTICEYFTI